MSGGINYADVQALVQRGMKRGLLRHGAPVRAIAPQDLPKPYPESARHIPSSVWAGLDWSKKNPEIARQLGCSPPTVSVRRKQYAPETYVQRHSKFDWSGVDWSQPSSVIARQVGCAKSLVFRTRRLRAPETLRRHPAQNRPPISAL